MKMEDAIRKAMKASGVTQMQLAQRMGYKYQSVISERLRRGHLPIEVARQMVNHCGYELVVQPIRAGKRPAGQMVIGGEEE